jgi:hypothetical protein
MSAFEVCAIGTQSRLAQVEVERDALKADAERLSDVVSKVNARCDHLGIRLGEVIDERDALLAALKRLLPAYRKAVKLYDPNTDDNLTVAARAAIARIEGGGNG